MRTPRIMWTASGVALVTQANSQCPRCWSQWDFQWRWWLSLSAAASPRSSSDLCHFSFCQCSMSSRNRGLLSTRCCKEYRDILSCHLQDIKSFEHVNFYFESQGESRTMLCDPLPGQCDSYSIFVSYLTMFRFLFLQKEEEVLKTIHCGFWGIIVYGELIYLRYTAPESSDTVSILDVNALKGRRQL